MRIKRMETVLIGIIGLLVGVGATLGTQQALKGDQDRTEDVLKAIKDLESEIDKAEAQATKNLTQTDLLQVPCSAQYIIDNGEGLCREMWCRMNRQGSAQGAESSECNAISNTINSKFIVEQCMKLWNDESTAGRRGIDQNSKFAQCLHIFDKRK